MSTVRKLGGHFYRSCAAFFHFPGIKLGATLICLRVKDYVHLCYIVLLTTSALLTLKRQAFRLFCGKS